MSIFSCDVATGDLYENGFLVGKLVTGNSGAWLRLIEQANAFARGQYEQLTPCSPNWENSIESFLSRD